MDWDLIKNAVDNKLDSLSPPSHLHTQGELDKACKELTEVLQKVIKEKVPTVSLRVKAKCWWTKELKTLRQEANKKGQKASEYKNWPEHFTHAEH